MQPRTRKHRHGSSPKRPINPEIELVQIRLRAGFFASKGLTDPEVMHKIRFCGSVDLKGSDLMNGAGDRQASSSKVIKRYANRKLYDTGESRYITLDEIGQLIRDGVDVQIVDNRSKGDLTSVTLAQIILEEEKKQSHMPLGVLRDIIRTGGETLTDFIQNEVGPRVSSLREGAEAGLKLLRRDGPVPRDREGPGSPQATLAEWQRRVDDRVRQAVDTMTSIPSLGREIMALSHKLDELEARLDRLEPREKIKTR
jgi:polyhydroxyalkanoate synthesis repressor PhaR